VEHGFGASKEKRMGVWNVWFGVLGSENSVIKIMDLHGKLEGFEM
jgi:hypothetical protein